MKRTTSPSWHCTHCRATFETDPPACTAGHSHHWVERQPGWRRTALMLLVLAVLVIGLFVLVATTAADHTMVPTGRA